MTVAEVVRKMVEYSKGDLHDINHFMKVYAYAKTIAEGENLSPEQQKLVEVTAVVHDIACPLCRVKYGNANGKHQDKRHFQELVFKTVIQRNVKLSEAPSYGLPTILYDAEGLRKRKFERIRGK